ncbi:Uncharacterised protein [Escherichia coli]|nr:hypothetical protein EC13107_234c00020 [Escherichia coli]SQP08814.1 Uncharacterised protein [Escherichia coli]SQP70212.1 Uncharacterised protein [Escherichia coli]SQZ25983.1 Uncharacterised protein [Escherichia coli]SQZ92899.1 Uncharacterised protein [Escherichia coli]
MMWYFPPSVFICHECNWKKTVSRTGDVLTEGDNIFTVYPVCGSELVERRRAIPVEVFFPTFNSVFPFKY